MLSLWGRASVTAASAAHSIRMSYVPSLAFLALTRCQRVGAPQQLDLLPHRIGEMQVEVIATRIALQRALRLRDRPVDDGETLTEHAYRRGVEVSLIARERFLELRDGGVGRRLPGASGSICVGPGRPHGGWARRGRVRRPRMKTEPHAAGAQQYQRDTRSEELPDGQTETAGYPGPPARGQPRANVRPQVSRRGAVFKRLRARDHLTQLRERRVARPAGREVRLERDALFVVELAVEILRQPVRPLIVHRSKCLRSAIRA